MRARAFAPGHATGIFRPAVEARDPRARGSIGAGVVLELGVRAEATFRAGARREVRVVSDLDRPLPISLEAARRLAPSDRGTTSVVLRHELPVGQGFGMSAAGAVATALAVATLSNRSRREALQAAHLADLFGRGGLGGVASILGGGLEFRRRAGVPPWGDVRHVPWEGPVFVGTLGGPLPSSRILASPRALARITEASERLPELLRELDAERFWEWSERFTDRAGLAPRELTALLRSLRHRGARAIQAMFGRSFVAYAENAKTRQSVIDLLASLPVAAAEVRPARSGARALSRASAR